MVDTCRRIGGILFQFVFFPITLYKYRTIDKTTMYLFGFWEGKNDIGNLIHERFFPVPEFPVELYEIQSCVNKLWLKMNFTIYVHFPLCAGFFGGLSRVLSSM